MRSLVYFDHANIAPVGGPAGYLFSLREGLRQIGNKDVSFLDCQSPARGRLKAIENENIKRLMKAVVYMKAFRNASHCAKVNLQEYDSVHFHVVKDVYEARTSLRGYPGKVLLTVHSPCLPSVEVIDGLTDWEKSVFGSVYRRLGEMDRYAFEAADVLIFPCEEAEEPYLLGSEWYPKLREEKQIEYCLTGSIRKERKTPPHFYRRKYGIPDDGKVVSYVGRHNEIKGYSDLLEIGKRLLDENENIWFLVGGMEEPLRGLEHPRWVEIGWSNDAAGLIQEADVFILPNRQTYFDLVLIECLSLGVPVIASSTGGNKFFARDGSKDCGVVLYDGISDCVEKTLQLFMDGPEACAKLSEAAAAAYDSTFRVDRFAERYVNTLKAVLEKE